MQELPQDYIPDWLKAGLTLIAGGGAVHYLRAWLENRRLSNSDFRQTLLDRINTLESKLDKMHDEVANLRVKLVREIVEKRILEQQLAQINAKKKLNGGPHVVD